MSNVLKLPGYINPRPMAERRTHLAGSLPLASMSRLASLMNKSEGEAAIILDFVVDNDGFVVIKGCIKAELLLTCQRCLKPFHYCVDSIFMLSPVFTDEMASKLPDEYDPLEMQEETIKLVDLIEDELLLLLPMVALHPEKECTVQLENALTDSVIEKINRPNPFAELASKKRDK